MDTIFHILDCQIRDETVEAEDEETREVSYEDVEVEDDEVQDVRKKGGSKLQPNARVVIHLFGSTASGQHVRCNVRNFEPFFYIRLPNGDRSNQLLAKKAVENYICRMLGNGAMDLITLTIVQKKELFGYHAQKSFPFLEIRVLSMNAFQQVKNIFLNDRGEPCIGGKWKAGRENLGAPFGKGESPAVYESNLDPLLRFFHLRNISPCNWVSVKGGGEPKHKMDVYEVDCDFEDISPCTNPPAATAPFRVASWDIECWSSTGEFPLAERKWSHIVRPFFKASADASDFCNAIVAALQGAEVPQGCYPLSLKHEPKGIQEKTLDTIIARMNKLCAKDEFSECFEGGDKDTNIQNLGIYLEKEFGSKFPLMGDPIIQIGVILTRLGSNETEHHIFVLDTCAEVPGAVVHSYKDEKTLLLEWCKWVHKMGVDILIGYNIFGFDEVYFWNRLTYFDLEDHEAVQELHRLCDLGGVMKLDEKRLSSSAMGDNFLYLWNTTGRLRVDLYHYIKRNNALGSYKLDDTSRYFLGEKVKGVKDGGAGADKWEITVDLGKSKQGPAVGRSLVFMNGEGVTLCDKLTIHSLDKETGVMVVDAPDDVEVIDVEKWAIVKDDLSPAEMFKLHLGTAEDRATIAKYCVQDCALVLDLFRKLEVFNNAMSMANVCSVPIGYIFIRGQGIKIESLIYKFCYENQQCIQVLPQAGGNTSSYEGAIVLDPTPGFYTVPVGVADFASLYPSTIISENISHDTLVWVKEYDNDMKFKKLIWGSDEYDNYPGVLYTDIQFDNFEDDPNDTRKNKAKIKTGVRVCRYAQDAMGTIPQITGKLLAQRKATRKLIEKEPDVFRKALLDAEQLAYKVTANSLYGQLGSGTFKVRLQSLAASVTAYGRKQIMFAKDMIMEFYGENSKYDMKSDIQCKSSIVYGDTDSLFISFHPTKKDGSPLSDRESLEATIHLTEEAGKLVSQALKPPHDFEFDKVYWPFLIFSKKRDVGNLYESNPDEFYQKSMGIALKRRDYAPIVKKIYGGAVQIMLGERNVAKAANFVRQACNDLVNGKWGLGPLTISKSLRAEYANPNAIAHKVLADRMAARDPGNAPASGDRIPYVYILPPAGQKASDLQGDRIEAPSYIREKGLKPDFMFYITNQISNPVCQMFGLLLEHMPGFPGEPPNGWPTDEGVRATVREDMAYKLLFSEAQGITTSNKTKAFAEKFGFQVIGKIGGKKNTDGTTVSVAPIPTNTTVRRTAQTTLDGAFADRLLIEASKKPKRKTDKKEI